MSKHFQVRAHARGNEANTTDADYCDAIGAAILKARIEEYWRKKGFEIEARLVRKDFIPGMRSARFDVVSNMRNGYPLMLAESLRFAGDDLRRAKPRNGCRPIGARKWGGKLPTVRA